MKQLISRAKNAGLSPEQAAQAARSGREHEAAALYARYQKRLTAFNAVDFDDLIRLPVELLESDTDCVGGWRERIGYLLVDECQDTNDAQYRLLRALAGDAGQFTCVGDDDQSIYAWRGANPDNLLQLGSDYPALQIVKLEQNYRCSNRVLRAANALIANNPHEHPKTLWSDAGRRRAHPRVGMQGRRARGRKSRRRNPVRRTETPGARGASSASCSAATTRAARWKRRCSCCACPTT